MDHIPNDLLSTESITGEEPVQDPSFIFIHPLRNGLYRVTVRASHNVKGKICLVLYFFKIYVGIITTGGSKEASGVHFL